MEQHTSIDIDAPVARVWAVMRDVERWPEWTASVRSVTLLDDGLRVGARARIDQPRIPTTVWTVTGLTEGHDFTWEASGPGTLTTGRHGVEGTGRGTCRATLSITQSGLLGSVVGRGYRSLTDRYLVMEAAGLKARAESPERTESPTPGESS
ncbi:SRPBCC family protein [Terrabacter sp. Root85]|uniref:SRPBCC family protein n=1 Tax=Terrabacter sp. Root85 TaxID=1736603 RepID=UPI0009E95E4B|nr:SRPBCC family protein [Terrabacter sp. Root85]